jgi:hypothetical protein
MAFILPLQAMMFELMLPQVRAKHHQVTALHLMAALAMIGSGAVLRQLYPPAAMWSLVLGGTGIVLLFFTMFRNKWLTDGKANRTIRILELLLMAGLSLFFIYKQWTPPAVMFGVLAAAMLFALFWEQKANNVQTIRIDEQGIKLPMTSRKRSISWPEVQKVILRFGILTIDCEDNRLYQWDIAATDIDKELFETFCYAQVEAGKKKRVADW